MLPWTLKKLPYTFQILQAWLYYALFPVYAFPSPRAARDSSMTGFSRTMLSKFNEDIKTKGLQVLPPKAPKYVTFRPIWKNRITCDIQSVLNMVEDIGCSTTILCPRLRANAMSILVMIMKEFPVATKDFVVSPMNLLKSYLQLWLRQRDTHEEHSGANHRKASRAQHTRHMSQSHSPSDVKTSCLSVYFRSSDATLHFLRKKARERLPQPAAYSTMSKHWAALDSMFDMAKVNHDPQLDHQGFGCKIWKSHAQKLWPDTESFPTRRHVKL